MLMNLNIELVFPYLNINAFKKPYLGEISNYRINN